MFILNLLYNNHYRKVINIRSGNITDTLII